MEIPVMPEESSGEVDTEDTPSDSPVQARISPVTDSDVDTWLPLRAASEQAGVSVSALRKWYRLEKIQSELRPGPTGDQRYVLLSEVMEHAGRLHRDVPKTDLTTLAEQPAQPSAPSWSDDVLPIPVDAWNKMIEQLGNLHEAGQQLATEAAARAKAETEAQFLRERVTDLLAQLEEARQTRPPVDPLKFVEDHGGEPPSTEPSYGDKLAAALEEIKAKKPDLSESDAFAEALWKIRDRDVPMEGLDYPWGGKPGDPMPDEIEQTITEIVEEAISEKRPWWQRVLRRGGN